MSKLELGPIRSNIGIRFRSRHNSLIGYWTNVTDPDSTVSCLHPCGVNTSGAGCQGCLSCMQGRTLGQVKSLNIALPRLDISGELCEKLTFLAQKITHAVQSDRIPFRSIAIQP